ncbi:hypothetical protein SFRURICE_006439 [Spodoptera frugiperda]|nr:hypothetical protein SFRURICE_006439 [Spodoptera frugiperda]
MAACLRRANSELRVRVVTSRRFVCAWRYGSPSLSASSKHTYLSGCKCDCWARGLGFDSRVGRSIPGLFSVFYKITCHNVHPLPTIPKRRDDIIKKYLIQINFDLQFIDRFQVLH